jgi:membrane associated rhomboid family serine protease
MPRAADAARGPENAVISVNTLLIVANVVAYALIARDADLAMATLALWPIGTFVDPDTGIAVGFRPWQLVTSAFLHANLPHLLLNMIGLASFGSQVERALGSRRYLRLYFVAVLAAALVQLVVVSAAAGAQPYATVGASGGVFGVLLAFGMLFPRRMVMLLFPPIPMPAWLLVTLFAAIELTSGVFGTQGGIAHFAHLGGMLGAFVLVRRWRRIDRTRMW